MAYLGQGWPGQGSCSLLPKADSDRSAATITQAKKLRADKITYRSAIEIIDNCLSYRITLGSGIRAGHAPERSFNYIITTIRKSRTAHPYVRAFLQFKCNLKGALAL